MRSDGDGDSDDDSVLELGDDLDELSLQSLDDLGLSSESNLVGFLTLGTASEKNNGKLGD